MIPVHRSTRGILTMLAFLLTAHSARADAVAAGTGVLRRTLGPRAASFVLREIPKENGLDVFVIAAKEGKVSVAGSSGVALARGAYEYIRRNRLGIVTWEGSRLDLPDVLPNYPETRVVCPNRYRHYFNVCTFGYTMAWWDWQRWQLEIDWMALHGINNPLAMTGQEFIWQRVWRSLGVTDKELEQFFVGPAFLPWHWMGNIDGHAGPLPPKWIARQADLQKQILARERELGMIPVVPAFAGFVPGGFKRAHADARVRDSTAWAGFGPTHVLDARDPMFIDIGRRFIQEYRKEFGSDHLYLADTFNEMTPPVKPESKLDDLAAYGDAVYRSITAGDADGIWVMQGWLFYNERHFWGEAECRALLSKVPNERMILLDLACDQFPVWKAQPAFREKPWIACTLHNFGQTTPLFGKLQDFATWPAATLRDTGRGRMVGMGLTMEGIEQNAVVYELLTDAMWRDAALHLDVWIPDYCACRYGEVPAHVSEAWKRLREAIYGSRNWSGRPAYFERPRLDCGNDVGAEFVNTRQIVANYLDSADRLGKSPLFQRDLVDIEKCFLGQCAGAIIERAMSAWDAGDSAVFEQEVGRFLDLMTELDRLLACCPPHRLSEWIAAARCWGDDPAARDYFEYNARLQVTLWGGPVLHEYAAKEWSGLVVDFYAQRWRRFFDELRRTMKAHDFDAARWEKDITTWEQNWTHRTDLPTPAATQDVIALARQLFVKYRDITPAPPPPTGIAVGKPVTVSGGTEGDHKPAFAVDGISNRPDEGWYASPYPQWLQIDLEKETDIGRVEVVNYSDGQRYYQYTVEASLGGKEWKRIVDMSQNTEPAKRRGKSHVFTHTPARYVRINLLRNSANIGVHLLELRVFPPA